MEAPANTLGLKQTPLTCNGHTRPIVHLDFSKITKTGFYFISASKDGKPMLRKGETGDWIGTFEGHKGAIWGVVINDDATIAATASADFTAKIWDAEGGNEMCSFTHNHVVKSVDFSADNSLLLTGSNEKIIRIFDISNHTSDPQLISAHTDNIRHVLFSSPDDQLFVSASDDHTVRFWDRRSNVEINRLTFDEKPYGIEVSDDKTILSICYGKNVLFFDLTSMTKMHSVSIPTDVYTSSLHPDKSTFVCGGEDFVIYKYDFKTGELLDSFKNHFGAVHCIRYSPDGELYASGSEDGTLRLWQNTIGTTYGLWKFVNDEEKNDST